MKKILAVILATGFASTAAIASDFATVDADQNGELSSDEWAKIQG